MKYRYLLLLSLLFSILFIPIKVNAQLPNEITIYKLTDNNGNILRSNRLYVNRGTAYEKLNIYETQSYFENNKEYTYSPDQPLHVYKHYTLTCEITKQSLENSAYNLAFTGESIKFELKGANENDLTTKCYEKIANKIVEQNNLERNDVDKMVKELTDVKVLSEYCSSDGSYSNHPEYLSSSPNSQQCGQYGDTYYQALSKIVVSDLRISSPIFKAETSSDKEQLGYAYCLNPDLPFGGKTTTRLNYTKTIDLSTCSSTNDIYCKLSYIAKNAEKYSTSFNTKYSIALTAMRLLVNDLDNGKYYDFEEDNAYISINNGQRDASFKRTAEYFDKTAYDKKIAQDNHLLYSDDDTMKNAMLLYKDAKSANYESLSPLANYISHTISNNTLKIFIETNLDLSTKIDKVVLPDSIPLKYDTSKCDYNDNICITLTIDNYDKYKKHFDNGTKASIFYSGSNKYYGEMAIYGNIGGSGKVNQSMFVFNDLNQSIEVKIKISGFGCMRVGTYPNYTYYDENGNETNKDVYEKQCTCTQRADGNYYDKDGNLIGSDEDARQKMLEICEENASKQTTCEEIISTCNSSQNKTITCDEIRNVCSSSQADGAICEKLIKACDSNSSKTSTCEEIINTCTNKPVTCDTKPKVVMPDNCGEDGTNNEGVIEDPLMCTILSNEAAKAKYKISDSLNNKYCDIYCRNSYKFRFMSKTEVLSMRFFQYDVYSKYADHSNPNNQYLSTVVTVTKECISDIDYDQWKKDFLAAYDDVRIKWNEYKEIEVQVNNAKAQTKTATCNEVTSTAVCSSHCNKYECEEYQCKTYENGSCTEYYNDDNHCKKRYTDNEHCADLKVTAGEGCAGKEEKCTYYTWNNAYYKATDKNGNEYEVNASGKSSCNVTCDNNDCDGCINSVVNGRGPTKDDVKTKQAEYEAAVAKVNGLIEQINNCNIVNDSNRYKSLITSVKNYISNNDLDISYSESFPIKTGSDFVLNKANDESYSIEKMYGFNDNINIYCASCEDEVSSLASASKSETVKKWECNGSAMSAACDLENVEVPTNKVAYFKLSTDAVYYQSTPFSANIYTGNIVNSTESSNSFYLGLHVYPVNKQKTTDGKKVIVTYKNDIDNMTRTYSCTYNVISELPFYACDDNHHVCSSGSANDDATNGGFGLYFKNVNLKNLFTNDVPYNWSGSKNSKIINDIQNVGDDLWSQNPAYSVTLTPSDISSIRKYNKTIESVNESTGKSNGGYMNESLTCTGYDCKSNFIEKDLKDLIGSEKIIDNINEFNVHLYSKR